MRFEHLEPVSKRVTCPGPRFEQALKKTKTKKDGKLKAGRAPYAVALEARKREEKPAEPNTLDEFG